MNISTTGDKQRQAIHEVVLAFYHSVAKSDYVVRDQLKEGSERAEWRIITNCIGPNSLQWDIFFKGGTGDDSRRFTVQLSSVSTGLTWFWQRGSSAMHYRRKDPNIEIEELDEVTFKADLARIRTELWRYLKRHRIPTKPTDRAILDPKKARKK